MVMAMVMAMATAMEINCDGPFRNHRKKEIIA